MNRDYKLTVWKVFSLKPGKFYVIKNIMHDHEYNEKK